MRVLITGGEGRLARAVVRDLSGEFSFRAVAERFSTPPGVEHREGDLRDPAFASAAVEGVDAVLHLAPLSPEDADDSETLDRAARGTYSLMTAALDAGVGRFIAGSALALFDQLPAAWKVTEEWRPRPRPLVADIGPWLAELVVRECVRTEEMIAACLRFGRIVTGEEAAREPYDPRWLHIDDAVVGVDCALRFQPRPGRRQRGWWIFHVTAAGPRARVRLARAGRGSFGYHPAHDFSERWPAAEPPEAAERAAPVEDAPAIRRAIPPRPIRRVAIFGAGGPLGAAAARAMEPDYALRLVDLRPIAEIAAEGRPQSPGAPLPAVLGPPHECVPVDVTRPSEVSDACRGMDAVVNCTVIREDRAGAFRVNVLGAYHMARAAVEHGIRRVVQTGPQMVEWPEPLGYEWDYEIPSDAPPRPGRDLYLLTKYLGGEVLRVFSEAYGLEVPALLFTALVDPMTAHGGFSPAFGVSWRDAGRAVRQAVAVPSFPTSFEPLHILADLPHGRYTIAKARTMLGWQPVDDLSETWRVDPGAAGGRTRDSDASE